MLKRIYIDNFRCFVNFEYKPERKQLLLGANGSGKSSLLDAIQMVKAFVESGNSSPFQPPITFKASKTRWLNQDLQVFIFVAEISGLQYEYRLEMDVSKQFLSASVFGEALLVDHTLIAQNAEGNAVLCGAPKQSPRMQASAPSGSILSLFRSQSREIEVFLDWLSNDIFCLRINPLGMRKLGQVGTTAHPDRDISDIASWYNSVACADLDLVSRLQASLREVFDGAASLQSRPSPEPGSAEFGASLGNAGGKFPYSLDELSDGQRCLIALYMILHFLIEKGHTVFLDEPDNFLSLREIQPWLLQAEAAADDSKGQLILISHHPEILNQWAHEYGMRMFRVDGGPVQIEKYKTDYDDILRPAEVVARGWEND